MPTSSRHPGIVPRDGERRPRLGPDDQSVSPVLGTILVLAITIAGITVALFWGAPVLQRLRDQSDLEVMTSQMLEVREASLRLSGADNGRAPGLSLPAGQVQFENATWMMITENFSTDADCDWEVTDWDDLDGTIGFAHNGEATAGSCNNPGAIPIDIPLPGLPCALAATGCLRAYTVVGDEFSPLTGSTLGQSSATFDEAVTPDRDYLFQMTNTAGTQVFSQAWLIHSDRLTWEKESSQGGARLDLENGAVYSRTGGQYYQVGAPKISENTLGDDEFFFRVPTLHGEGTESLSGRGSHQVLLTLTSSELRESTAVHRVRLSFSGERAEAWCNSLLLRNIQWERERYLADGDPGEVGATYCAQGENGAEIIGVVYMLDDMDNDGTDDTDGVPDSTFDFRFLHGVQRATLQL